MKLDEYRRMMEINGSENRNPHDNKSSDKWDIALQQNSTITLSITVVNAFSVEAIVTVSTPSHVWCEALKHGDVFDVNSLLLTDRQQYISKSATAEVSSLSPSTQYFLHCVAVPYSKEYSMSIAKKEPFTTDPARFSIKSIHRWPKKISYTIDCNIRAVAVCYLMTKKPEVLDTFEFTTSRDHHVTFRMDSNTPLLTKCELYDTNNNLLMSTRVEDIDPIVPIWKILLIIILIPLLLGVALYLWKHRKVYDPSLEIINEEDAEKLQLLKSVVVSPQRNDFDSSLEVRNTVQCQRCGFINSEKSTVCRECNALLKGNSFFISSQQARYY